MNVDEIRLCTPPANLYDAGYTTREVHANFALRRRDETSPFILKAMSGLDADEIAREFLGAPYGTKIHSFAPKKRTVVLLFKLNRQYGNPPLIQNPSGVYMPEATIGDLRDLIYRAVSYSPTGELELQFYYKEAYVASLYGHMSKVESSVFSKETELQVTIECDYTFLRSNDYEELTTQFGGNQYNWTVHDYTSTAPHGFLFQGTFTSAAGGFSIKEFKDSGWYFSVDYIFEAGDQLFFSSEEGNKYFYIRRLGPPPVVWTPGGPVTTNAGPVMNTIHLLDRVKAGSIWPVIRPGFNPFYFSHTTFTEVAGSHRHTYWGI